MNVASPEMTVSLPLVKIEIPPPQMSKMDPSSWVRGAYKPFSCPFVTMYRCSSWHLILALACSTVTAAELEYYVLVDPSKGEAGHYIYSWSGCLEECERLDWEIACIQDDDDLNAAQEAIDRIPDPRLVSDVQDEGTIGAW